jgi:hypothetical protein
MPARAATWLGLAVFAAACGGAAPPPESPAPPSAAPSDSAAEPEKPSEAAPQAAPAASEADVSAVLQLVVEDPELDKYLHLGEPGRFPLQLSGEKLPPGLKLVKATEPVKVVDGPKSKKDAVLVITELDVAGDKANVRYRYDVEGIRGTVTLARSAHGWELKNSRIVER